MNLARIRPHPTDQQAVILDTPYELNHEMSKFGPAMMAKEHKGFVMLTEHLGAFYRFAATLDIQVVDERAKPPGERSLMPECANCGQPASLMAQPRRCPACGKDWVAAFVGTENPHSPLKKACVRCGHQQLRSFAYCRECGEVMPPDDIKPARHILAGRPNLRDPMSLSDVMHEAVAELETPTTAEWAQLVKLEIRPCKAPDQRRMTARPVHDTPLEVTP